MKQEITPNARNKQEFPPSRIGESNASSIVLHTAEDNSIQLDVKLENETVWLSQQQMAMLFDTTPQNITMHIRNIYKVDELQKESTCKDFLQVRKEGKREVVRSTKFYNLDLIISVGYRVNTKRGILFRQWANKVLKDYLVKGYAVNQKITQQRYEELKDVVRLMSRTYQLQESVTTEEADGLLTMIGDYVYVLDTLDHYDFQQLTLDKTTQEEPFHATYENAMEAISRLKPKFGGSALFANEKDESFKSSIGQIYQTFGGEELYPSVESGGEEPFLQRRQQAHSCHAVPVVHGPQQGALCRRRPQAHRRQHTGGPHADDSRESPRRERHHRQAGSKPNQSEQSIIQYGTRNHTERTQQAVVCFDAYW